MKLFKSIDERIKELGFEKVEIEDKFGVGVCYKRVVLINNDESYVHRLDILHKANGNHIIQSYQKEVNSDGFNNTVGLDYKKTKLAMKKYRQLKRKYKW